MYTITQIYETYIPVWYSEELQKASDSNFDEDDSNFDDDKIFSDSNFDEDIIFSDSNFDEDKTFSDSNCEEPANRGQ